MKLSPADQQWVSDVALCDVVEVIVRYVFAACDDLDSNGSLSSGQLQNPWSAVLIKNRFQLL